MQHRMGLGIVLVLMLAGCEFGLGEVTAGSESAPEASAADSAPGAADAADNAPVEAASSIEPVSSAEQKLIQMEPVEFFATQSLAVKIAKTCESLNFDFRRNADVAALRGDPERAFGAAVKRRSVRARTAELEAAFLVKHTVDPAGDDLCAAGRAEQAEGTALSGTLRSAG